MARTKMSRAEKRVTVTSAVLPAMERDIREYAELHSWSVSQAIAKLVALGLSQVAVVGAGNSVSTTANRDAARV